MLASEQTRERLAKIGKWINGGDKALWDILVAMRGPDSGLGEPTSEMSCQSSSEYGRLYNARVARKMDTVAVLRHAAFRSVPGARLREAKFVTLPPSSQWDHFDKHVAEAAQLLGIEVRVGS